MSRGRSNERLDERQFGEADFALPARALHGLAVTDAWPPGLRACVHEFGFAIVDAFVTCGISEPRLIRHLVAVCWMGARSPLDRPGVRGAGLRGQLDAVLLHSGSELSGDGLVRFLKQSGQVVLPLEPMPIMVDASLEETARLGLVSKREKHTARLKAALRAGALRLWPQLFGAG